MSYISFIVFVIEMVLITCYFLGFLFHLTLYACIFVLDFVLLKILKNMANKMHFKLIVEVSKFDRCFKFTACKKKNKISWQKAIENKSENIKNQKLKEYVGI